MTWGRRWRRIADLKAWVAYAHLDVTARMEAFELAGRYGKLDALVNNAGISISVEGGRAISRWKTPASSNGTG